MVTMEVAKAETEGKTIQYKNEIRAPVTLTYVLGLILLTAGMIVSILIPMIVRNMIDGTEKQGTLKLILFYVIHTFLLVTGRLLISRKSEDYLLKMRTGIFRSILGTRKEYLDKEDSSSLTTRIINETSMLGVFYQSDVPQLFSNLIFITASMFYLIRIDAVLTGTTFGLIIVFILCLLPIGPVMGKLNRRILDGSEKVNSVIRESIQQIVNIKTGNLEDNMTSELDKAQKNIRNASIRMKTAESLLNPIGTMFLFAIIAIIFIVGTNRIKSGYLTFGNLVSFVLFMFMIINPLSQCLNFMSGIGKFRESRKKIVGMLELPMEDLGGNTPIPELPEDIVLRNVHFSYGEEKVLDGVDLTIRRFSKTALVGPSGSGKTTILNLIERLYDVEEGDITCQGISIRDFHLSHWRDYISLAAQDHMIMSGTLREYLLLGKNVEVSDESIMAALKGANLLELSDKLDMKLNDSGKLLSGGQRQRLQIARAILKDSKVILLDEATSNLDADSEYTVNSYMTSLRNKATLITVAHRLSSVKDADVIYFLDNGRITGKGTHEELIRTHETYRRYVREQMLADEGGLNQYENQTGIE